MTLATGAFEVKLTPQPTAEKAASPILGRKYPWFAWYGLLPFPF